MPLFRHIPYSACGIVLTTLLLSACNDDNNNRSKLTPINTANQTNASSLSNQSNSSEVIASSISSQSSSSENNTVADGTENKPALEYKGIAKEVCTKTVPTEEIDFNNLSIELVKNGFKGAEGPVWIASEGKLFFSEINRDPGADMIAASDDAVANIIALDPNTKEHDVWLEASGSNGIALSPDGQTIYAAITSSNEIASFDLTSKAKTVIADSLSDGTKFNATNDIAVRSDGILYVTDPTWGGPRTDHGDPAPMSMPAISISPDGTANKIDTDLVQPNGIALSPDEKKLYVNGIVGKPQDFGWNSPSVLYSYDVNEDGSVANRTRVLDYNSGSDGMTVDCAGNVYTTARGAVIVLNSKGKKLGEIPVFHYSYQASNVAFGGENNQTLFITVEQRVTAENGQPKEFGVYKVDLPIQGLPY